MRLSKKPACGIDDQDVEVACLGLLAGVVGDAGRVGPRLGLDDVAADPLAPDRQLLDRRRPEFGDPAPRRQFGREWVRLSFGDAAGPLAWGSVRAQSPRDAVAL